MEYILLKILIILVVLFSQIIGVELRAVYTDGNTEWIDNNVNYTQDPNSTLNANKSVLELYSDLGYNTVFDWISPKTEDAEWKLKNGNWVLVINNIQNIDYRQDILDELNRRNLKCKSYGLEYRPHYFSWGHGQKEQEITSKTKYTSGENSGYDFEFESLEYIGGNDYVPDFLEWVVDEISFGTQSKDWFIHYLRIPEINYDRHIDPFSSATIDIFEEMTDIIAEFYTSNNITPEYYLLNTDEAPRVKDKFDTFGEYFAEVVNNRIDIIDNKFGNNKPKKVLIWADMITPIGTFYNYYNKSKSSKALDFLDKNRVVPVLWLYAQHYVEFSNDNYIVKHGTDLTFTERINKSVSILGEKGFDFVYTFATDFLKTGGGVYPIDDGFWETFFSLAPFVGELSHAVAWGYAFSHWEDYKKDITINNQKNATKKVYDLIKNHPNMIGNIFVYWGNEYNHRVNGLEFQSKYAWGNSSPHTIDGNNNMLIDFLEYYPKPNGVIVFKNSQGDCITSYKSGGFEYDGSEQSISYPIAYKDNIFNFKSYDETQNIIKEDVSNNALLIHYKSKIIQGFNNSGEVFKVK